MNARPDTRNAAIAVIQAQLAEAIAAPKCHKCGCLHSTVEALSATEAGGNVLADALARARAAFVAKRYDCLGCAICYPALAANAFAEAFPQEGAGLDLCPTEEPEQRPGWPPLPGDYQVIRYAAPVGVCTLNDGHLMQELVTRRPEGLAIVGTMHTENLGIERLIKNVLANPEIRFLILCGDDTQQAIGHLPGQSLVSLFENGIDDRGRIIDARGKRPVLRNATGDDVAIFRDQVEPVALIGERDADAICRAITSCTNRTPGRFATTYSVPSIERIVAAGPMQLTLDKAGYFVVYPERRTNSLVVEHYTNKGVLNCVIEGTLPGAIYSEAIARNLVTRLDHAAYLGRELARAEACLRDGSQFVQDAAPGVFDDRTSTASAPSLACDCAATATQKVCG